MLNVFIVCAVRLSVLDLHFVFLIYFYLDFLMLYFSLLLQLLGFQNYYYYLNDDEVMMMMMLVMNLMVMMKLVAMRKVETKINHVEDATGRVHNKLHVMSIMMEHDNGCVNVVEL